MLEYLKPSAATRPIRVFFSPPVSVTIHRTIESLMYWLPYHRFYLETCLSPDSVMRKIAEVTEPYQAMRFNLLGKTKPYQGLVNNHSFHIIRLLEYGNIHAPAIHGTLIDSASDSTIKLQITLCLRKIPFILSALWFIGLLSAELFALQLPEHRANLPFIGTLLGMFLFGYIGILVCFNLEAQKSKRFITELLQAKDVSF